MKIGVIAIMLLTLIGCQIPMDQLPTGVKVVVDGNSLTQSRNGVESMPSKVCRNFDGKIYLDIQSESGIGMVEMMYPAHLVRMYNAYIPGSILLVWEINHDISTGGFTADQAVSRLWNYCDLMKSRGYRIVTLTTLPAYGSVYAQPDFENKRIAVNIRMRAEWALHVDALVDIANDPDMGRPEACYEGVYYDPIDTVHLTESGSERVAEYVTTIIDSMIE